MIIHLAGQFCILAAPQYWMKCIGFAFCGFTYIKTSIAYIWAQELCPMKHNATVFSFINAIDSLSIAEVCFYYLFIGNSQSSLYLFINLVGMISFVVSFLVLPESPTWLLV